MPSGDVASIHDGGGQVRLTYRSFAGIVSIVAALVAAIVLTAGAAATLFLRADGRTGAAVAAATLSIVFSVVIAGLVPSIRVTLYQSSIPALTIEQSASFSFPFVTYTVSTPEGQSLGTLRSSILSRFGRNRWRIAGPEQYVVADAVEESFGSALLRKLAGKFNRKFQSNLDIVENGIYTGSVVRRPDDAGRYDFVEISESSNLDRRLVIALGTLVFGSEP